MPMQLVATKRLVVFASPLEGVPNRATSRRASGSTRTIGRELLLPRVKNSAPSPPQNRQLGKLAGSAAQISLIRAWRSSRMVARSSRRRPASAGSTSLSSSHALLRRQSTASSSCWAPVTRPPSAGAIGSSSW